MKIFRYIICVAFVSVMLAGCVSHKKGTVSNMSKQELAEAKTRYEAAVSAVNHDFDQLQAKVKYSLKNKSLSGKLYMERGKRLCMTVTMLGIELARVEADTHDVYVVDKFDKVYAKASIAEFAERLGLQNEANLETIEALLLGQIYLPGQGTAEKKDFKLLNWSACDDGSLLGIYKTGKYNLAYRIGKGDKLSQTLVSLPNSGSSVSWSYSSWNAVSKSYIPEQQLLRADGNGMSIDAQLSLSSIVLTPKGWNSFSPNGYQEVSFPELIQIIKKVAG